MRLSRDLLFVLLVFAVLIALTAYGAYLQVQKEQEQGQAIPYSTHSAAANGALALKMWMEDLGFQSRRLENQEFRLADDWRVLWILVPSQAPTETEVRELLDWVGRGNTLILADNNLFRRNPLLRELGVELRPTAAYVDRVQVSQPLLGPVPEPGIRAQASVGLALGRGDFVSYVESEGLPLLVSLPGPRGAGRIWLLSAPYVLTNEGLRDPGNAALAGALLRTLPRDGAVVWDEYHLGFDRIGADDIFDSLLLTTTWGWGILFALLVVLAYLGLNGQRFGRVMPLRQATARRSPAEYVRSMALLFRRGGKRRYVAQHYRQELKRVLGRPYRVNPELPDADFVRELARYRETLDASALLEILRALDRARLGERQLIHWAGLAVKFARPEEKGP